MDSNRCLSTLDSYVLYPCKHCAFAQRRAPDQKVRQPKLWTSRTRPSEPRIGHGSDGKGLIVDRSLWATLVVEVAGGMTTASRRGAVACPGVVHPAFGIEGAKHSLAGET